MYIFFYKKPYITWFYPEICTILFFRIYDPIPILLSKVDLRSDLILSPSWKKDLRSDTSQYFPIRSLLCILKDTVPQILRFLNLMTCKIERFISNKIARSHKIVILLRTTNFSLKNQKKMDLQSDHNTQKRGSRSLYLHNMIFFLDPFWTKIAKFACKWRTNFLIQ